MPGDWRIPPFLLDVAQRQVDQFGRGCIRPGSEGTRVLRTMWPWHRPCRQPDNAPAPLRPGPYRQRPWPTVGIELDTGDDQAVDPLLRQRLDVSVDFLKGALAPKLSNDGVDARGAKAFQERQSVGSAP
jgi:hypothetical protein